MQEMLYASKSSKVSHCITTIYHPFSKVLDTPRGLSCRLPGRAMEARQFSFFSYQRFQDEAVSTSQHVLGQIKFPAFLESLLTKQSTRKLSPRMAGARSGRGQLLDAIGALRLRSMSDLLCMGGRGGMLANCSVAKAPYNYET